MPTLLRSTLILTLVAGCAETRIRLIDPALLDAGHALGDSLSAIPEATPGSVDPMTRRLDAVGADLVSLVVAYEEADVAWGRLSDDADTVLDEPIDPYLAWDGDHLVAHYPSAQPAEGSVYRVDLSVLRERWVEEHRAGEPQQPGTPPNVVRRVQSTPPRLAGSLDLLTDATLDGEPVTLRIAASLKEAAVNGDACLSGGRVLVAYRILRDDGPDGGGEVEVGWHGCDRIQVHTTRQRDDLYPHDVR